MVDAAILPAAAPQAAAPSIARPVPVFILVQPDAGRKQINASTNLIFGGSGDQNQFGNWLAEIHEMIKNFIIFRIS
jgi:hypothetical protein